MRFQRPPKRCLSEGKKKKRKLKLRKGDFSRQVMANFLKIKSAIIKVNTKNLGEQSVSYK